MDKQRKTLVYVCSPLRGNIAENIELARQHCKTVIRMGNIPYAPHVALDGILNDNLPEGRKLALQIGLEMVLHCDELYVFGDHISEGMKREIEMASREGIPIRFMQADEAEEKKNTKIIQKYSEYIKEELSEQRYIECIERLKAEPDAKDDEEYPNYEEWKKEMKPDVIAEARELREKGILK